MKIRVKYHNNNIEEIKDIAIGDWIDLRSAETVSLKPFESAKISLGISMELPEGYEAWILPRSSTFDKWGIIQTNSKGVVDNSFSGDNDIWKMPVLAFRDTTIHENDRICQFRIIEKQPSFDVEKVDTLGNKDRGGFGSTGTN